MPIYYPQLLPPASTVWKLALLVASLSWLAQFLASANDRLVVDTGYAKYRGNLSYPDTVAYLGIPYAEPPLGERRFRAPIPLDTARVAKKANGAVVDATSYPDFCVQGSTGAGDAGGAGTEDCLKVNIYSPINGSNLPVLVYIHGGGYVYGNPTNFPFDHWVHQSPNVVIVSIYYRLSSFGFLAIPEFADTTNGDFNVGFLDQIQALKWIKRHIRAFGGDPSRVTINGESAGGSSVELHLVAHEDESLFSGAIVQSAYRAPLPFPEQQRSLFEFYAQRAGCGFDSLSSKLQCLRDANVSALARAQDAAASSEFAGPYNAFHPVVDGQIFTEFPTISLALGHFARIPLMVGATSNESYVLGYDIPSSLKPLFPGLDEQDMHDYLLAYPSSYFDSEEQRLATATGESLDRCCRQILASAYSSKGINTWAYRYNQPNPTSDNPTIVAHAAENWMMFRGSNTGYNGSATFSSMTPEETAFSQELIAYWLSFVRAEDPNTFKLKRSPVWDRFSLGEKKQIVLQQNTTTMSGSFIELADEKEVARCQFVASKAEKEQN
ncbi:alpha/beta-hydrolase [Guyanagaster necrorhizus]|uniref:Carboxylic ester hydrolase n=1 Tax=Guyanagaster necrorhizus TaxID=856835 RepID=A0A9P7VRQ9_9AGAR|nr:alpha/beta-hydrolase [Guyanagaster necrorhizus MCA 3950]KAG7444734.1 alpha/beta-hydrolase [Guyanagaster necrorhizus MCA 3950]